MALKGVEYEYRAVNLIKDGGEQKKEEYVKKRNPMGEVPTSVDGDTVLTQVYELKLTSYSSTNPDYNSVRGHHGIPGGKVPRGAALAKGPGQESQGG